MSAEALLFALVIGGWLLVLCVGAWILRRLGVE